MEKNVKIALIIGVVTFMSIVAVAIIIDNILVGDGAYDDI